MIENDIEYLLFVEHEEDMANYTHLRKVIPDLVKLVEQHKESAVKAYQAQAIERIATTLRGQVADAVLAEHKIYSEEVEREKSIYSW